MNRTILYRVCLAWALMAAALSYATAQMQFPGRPVGPSGKLKAAEVMYVLPPLDPLEVEARMEANRNSYFKTIEFATARQVDLSPETNGAWQVRDGKRVWLVHVVSPGAFSLGLVFNEFHLEPDVKVFVYDPDMRQVKGAFTSDNNKRSGILPVGHLDGQELLVEMQVPEGVADYGKLRIESVTHGFLDLKSRLLQDECDQPGIFGCSQACMIDVNCEEGDTWQKEKRSVVRILTTSKYCTGVLVNNTAYDGTPYILTAEHCISGQNYADDAVFLFNYESPSCFGGDGSTDRSISGADLMAVGDSIDFSLVRLSLVPPLSYDPYYAGWDRSGSNPTPTTSIHHPWGDVKKITLDFQAPSIPAQQSDVPYVDLDQYYYFSYWWIKRWDVGSTQAGSSGAPLFSESGKVIGLLSGGAARCGDSIGYDFDKGRIIYNNVFNRDDYYSQIKFAWDYKPEAGASLKTWLDPLNENPAFISGYEPVGVKKNEISSAGKYTLYPNPVNRFLQISRAGGPDERAFFEIITLSGASARSGQLEKSGFSTLDLSSLGPGIYFLRISGPGPPEIHKFIVIR